MKIEIYCNYGVLGAEKRNVYTYGGPHPSAVDSDRMIVQIPDGWETFQNQVGETMVQTPWGWTYEINDVLQGNKTPCFYALDENQKGCRVYLHEVK